jgi:hypothetical protein
MGLSNIRNLEHKYEGTKAQFPKKRNKAQSSIDKNAYTTKENY